MLYLYLNTLDSLFMIYGFEINIWFDTKSFGKKDRSETAIVSCFYKKGASLSGCNKQPTPHLPALDLRGGEG